ncbi:hypothetical protein DFH28DRAFT_1083457 [Melampsora americana]|nr:hypothetical protein DFH28DRAFT_1083457 [Melampsora americana]
MSQSNSHGFSLSGFFDVKEKRSEWQTYKISMGFGGSDCEKGFFPSNMPKSKNDKFSFEGSNPLFLATAKEFLGYIVDMVSVTGVSIVSNIKTNMESCCQPMKKIGAPDCRLITMVTLKHSEYHPTLRATIAFTVGYFICPTPKLSGIASIIRKATSSAALKTPETSFSKPSSMLTSNSKISITSDFECMPSQPAPPAKKKA